MNFRFESILLSAFLIPFGVFGMAQDKGLQVLSTRSSSLLFVRTDGAVYWKDFSDRETSLMKSEIQGSFLWFEKNGMGYLISDSIVLSKFDELSREMDALNENDPNRPKTLKRGDTYSSSESFIQRRHEIHSLLESMCEKAIQAGHATPKSRPSLPPPQ